MFIFRSQTWIAGCAMLANLSRLRSRGVYWSLKRSIWEAVAFHMLHIHSLLSMWYLYMDFNVFVCVFLCFADDIIEKQVQEGLIAPELREKVSFVLLRKHRHQTKKPIHRSLADIGKPSPSSKCPLTCPAVSDIPRIPYLSLSLTLAFSNHFQ